MLIHASSAPSVTLGGMLELPLDEVTCLAHACRGCKTRVALHAPQSPGACVAAMHSTPTSNSFKCVFALVLAAASCPLLPQFIPTAEATVYSERSDKGLMLAARVLIKVPSAGSIVSAGGTAVCVHHA